MEVRSPADVFAPLPEGYKPRDPRTTVLHRAVTEHLEGFLARASEEDPSGSGVPFHVEREMRAYRKCGILEYGFARVRCTDCGHEMLVGFSCKRRGFCPSCTARRASDCAVHLADRVLPHVPVRQWVLSFPRRVRWHLARDDKLLGKVIAIFHAELSNSYRRRAESDGVRGGQTGAVTFVQRFGSALNLNVHLHVVVPDGVFTLDDGADQATFHKAARPEPGLTRDVMLRTAKRVLLLLEHHFDDVDGVASFEPSVMDSLMARSIQTGQMPPGSGFSPPETDTASHAEGFSLHCGVHIHENDRQGLEHLLGYGGRGPLATSRLSQGADGRYAYSMRRPLPDGRTTLVLTGHELMGRLAALIPPPRVNMVRYHGVFAPKARLRPFVVPEPPADEQTAEGEEPPIALPKRPRSKHGAYRLDWAALLKRVFDVDVLECGKCGGRSRVIAVIKDGLTARKILDHLGLGDAQTANTQPTGPPQLDLPLAA